MVFRDKWDVPEAVGSVAKSLDDDASVFDDADVVLVEDGDTVVVAELADGYEGSCVETL